MQLAKLCLLGAMLLLAAATANALFPSPGETPSFPNLKAGAAVTTNITTYSTSSQYVTVRPAQPLPLAKGQASSSVLLPILGQSTSMPYLMATAAASTTSPCTLRPRRM